MVFSGVVHAKQRRQLRRTGKQISKKATLHVQHTFLYISLPLFCTTATWNFQKLLVVTRFKEEMSYVFSFTFFFHCRDDFHLALVAANIFYFLTTATKFLCCSSNNKKGLLCYLSQSRSRSLSPLFWLSFAGLPPTFSFSLSFSCSIFQICGHDN